MTKKKKSESAARRAVDAYRRTGQRTDPDGMYTGNCASESAADMSVSGGKIYLSPDALPVQDADDL